MTEKQKNKNNLFQYLARNKFSEKSFCDVARYNYEYAVRSYAQYHDVSIEQAQKKFNNYKK